MFRGVSAHSYVCVMMIHSTVLGVYVAICRFPGRTGGLMLGNLLLMGQATQLGRVVSSSLWLHVTVFHLKLVPLGCVTVSLYVLL